MKIQTLSVVVGNNSCNAKCPFCVSRMTGKCVPYNQEYNYRNLDKTCRFAQQNGVSTALITGKGEPTFSNDIFDVCKALDKYFPFIELQTNGSMLTPSLLGRLYQHGATTVILSMVHYNDDRNNEIYKFKAPLALKKTIQLIHEMGLSVRLSCIMVKGFVDCIREVEMLIAFCKENNVEQLTIRPVETPKVINDERIYNWTKKHKIEDGVMEQIRRFIDSKGTYIMQLVHGSMVYDYHGQNVCLSNCLTIDPTSETIRQLIVYPDGHVFYDWVYKGAIIL